MPTRQPRRDHQNTTARRDFYDPMRAFPLVRRYWDHNVVGEIVMTAGHSDGVEGEWTVRFYDFHRHERRIDPTPPAVRVEAFGDALAAVHGSGFLDLLVDRWIDQISQDDFVSLLIEEGWRDRTTDLRGTHAIRCPECRGTGWADEVGRGSVA